MQQAASLRRRYATGRIPAARVRAILTREGWSPDRIAALLRGVRLAQAW